ncbi:MAG: hypothetical protein J0H74_30630 [Chitinophagaceae bacterium]|nr:hypothetical protein [Chitinophagaceae bacterium]
MKNLSGKRDVRPVAPIAPAFVHKMYFDLEFNYTEGRTEQTFIVPDAPDNWETETCTLIPYVRYEYTRVTKEDPATSRRSGKAVINEAKKYVTRYASELKRGTVLRVIHDPIVIPLPNNLVATSNTTIIYLEESLGTLLRNGIASERGTNDFPPHLQELIKEASKKNSSGHKRRKKK